MLERVKKSRLAQVLILYLGASWVVIEVTGELQDALSLPEWVSPVAIILLVIGLVVVLATAWVQAHPATDVREEAGEVPESWEVGVGDLVGAIRRGELPHLTWGRAIVGGIVALSVMFGLAGILVLTRDRGADAGPAPAVAAREAGAGLAIVPFSVSGVDEDVYGQGMITLLATTLDEVPGIRAIDSRTVMRRWNEAAGDGAAPDLLGTLDVARRAGALYALVGSAVNAGRGVSLLGDLYAVDGGQKLGSASAQGPADSLMALVDRFSVEVARLLVAEGAEGTGVQHLESLTTSSLDALLSYVEGERLYREGSWNPALDAFDRAIEEDSTFALAHLRAAQVLGWSDASNPQQDAHIAAAERHAKRLPARERALLAAFAAVGGSTRGDTAAFNAIERAVRRYPDDPDLWSLLGELYVHAADPLLDSGDRGREGFEQALALAPDFVPYMIHLTEMEIAAGNSAAADSLLRKEEALVSDPSVGFPRGHRAAFAFRFGDAGAQRAAMDALEPADVGWAFTSLSGIENLPEAERLFRAFNARFGSGPTADLPVAVILAHLGRVRESLTVLDRSNWLDARNRTVLYHQGLIPESELPSGGWGSTWPEFGEAYTAAVRGDTATANRARAAFAAVLAEQGVETWLLTLLDAVRTLETRGPRVAEPQLVQLHEELPMGDPFIAPYVLWMIGDAYEQMDQDSTAFAFFRAGARNSPLAALRAARLADRLGRPEEARRFYRGVVIAWENADPQFQPWLEEARGWLERLPG